MIASAASKKEEMDFSEMESELDTINEESADFISNRE